MYNAYTNTSSPALPRYDTHEEEIMVLSKMLNLSVDDVMIGAQRVGFDADAIQRHFNERTVFPEA